MKCQKCSQEADKSLGDFQVCSSCYKSWEDLWQNTRTEMHKRKLTHGTRIDQQVLLASSVNPKLQKLLLKVKKVTLTELNEFYKTHSDLISKMRQYYNMPPDVILNFQRENKK